MRRDRASTATAATIARQASRMRREYPELYAYLSRRDETLRRALAGVPGESDIELCATQRPFTHIESTLRALEPGISEIAS